MRARDRGRLTLPLVLPALGGLAYLWWFGAPARLIAVNAGALLLGTLWVLWGRLPTGPKARLGLAASAAGLLFVPLLTGPALGGVARWLPLGPLMLHSGGLLLPLIAVLAARETRWAWAILLLATTALALQPDAAGLAGLALVSAVLAAIERSLALGAIGAAAAVLAATTFDAGNLPAQHYTEGVLAEVAGQSLFAAVGLGLLLVAAPLCLLREQDMRAHTHASTVAALTALVISLAAMASIGPFPFPLIGYGASPILGFALALGMAGQGQRRVPLPHGAVIG